MQKRMGKGVGLAVLALAIATGQGTVASAASTAQEVPQAQPSPTQPLPAADDSQGSEGHQSPQNSLNSEPVPVTQVLDYGAEPRQMLRMTPAVGAEQQTIMDMTTETAIAINGQSQPSVTAPGTRLVMDTVVTDIDENGLITVEFVYSDVQVIDAANLPPQTIELMRSQMSSIVGTTGTVVLDSRGRTQAFDLVAPDTLDATLRNSLDQMLQSFQQISSPLPGEAVGIGAVWQVPQTINIGGMELSSLATFELVGREGDIIELAVDVEQNGEVPIADLLSIPETVSVSTQSLNSNGSGQTFIDLNQIMPLGSELTINTQSSTSMTEAGVTATIEADVVLEMLVISDDFELPTRAEGAAEPVSLNRQ